MLEQLLQEIALNEYHGLLIEAESRTPSKHVRREGDQYIIDNTWMQTLPQVETSFEEDTDVPLEEAIVFYKEHGFFDDDMVRYYHTNGLTFEGYEND